MFNVGQDLLANLTFPNQQIEYTHFAYNEETGVGEVYVEFDKQVWTNTIKDRLAELGVRSITVTTFQNNDGNHSAASALNRVISVSKNDGFKAVVRGECNPRLAAKLEELQAAEKAEKLAKNAEFDEKTHFAVRLSLGEIKEGMATKEGLCHLEEVTQSNAEEIRSTFTKIDESYKETIIRQSAIIEALKDANDKLHDSNDKLHHHITTIDRKMMDRDERINNQTYAISKLNEDVRRKAEKIDYLHTVIEKKNQVILTVTSKRNAGTYGSSHASEASTDRDLLDQIKVLLAEAQEGRKRKHGDGDADDPSK
jgi:hypothetical protein